MIKAIGWIALVLLLAVVVVALLATRKPDSFRVERSAHIEAPPARVFALIDDLKQLKGWNPYERRDPSTRGSFGPVTAGVGASYAWDSDQVGAGRMTITESTPATRIVMRLDFVKPFAGTNQAEYTLQPDGSGTRVSWAMHGPSPFITKVMQVVLDVDAMIGRDFEAGLANLKAQAEAGR